MAVVVFPGWMLLIVIMAVLAFLLVGVALLVMFLLNRNPRNDRQGRRFHHPAVRKAGQNEGSTR